MKDIKHKTGYSGIILKSFRAAVKSGNLEWNRHAMQRMAERDVTRDEVLETLKKGERIEDYPEALPFPGALMYWHTENRPLHVVIAFSKELEKGFIVTVYEPDSKHFETDFKTRKKK